jgi:DNA-binding NtrC family response regulator
MREHATVTPPTTTIVSYRILVADDEESMRHFLGRGLKRLGHTVATVDNGDDAVDAWQRAAYDVAILDLKMPGTDGLQTLCRIRAADPEAIVLLMTAHGTVATAVEAMHVGAADFVLKPFGLDEMQLRLERALQLQRATRENRELRALLAPDAGSPGVVAQSRSMRELVRQIDLLRDSATTVLLTGESGTGKGLLARALHLASPRRDQPLVVMNCAAVPETLVESELFGHEPGAFTGARTRRAGLLLRAHRGTLFLDEIGDMSPATQAKIERFLGEREFQPLGGSEPVHVDVRILAATNRDLPALAQAGTFRPELLWRLDVVSLRVPSLRERRDDVPLLVAANLLRLAKAGAPPPRLTPDALAAMAAYDWPGNVRELENVVERMVVLAGSRTDLGLGDLPRELLGDSRPREGAYTG